MDYLSLDKRFNNSKLFFSRDELNKILSCYSNGVSRGKWKDYAINFNKNEAIFFIYKNSIASPDCVLTKTKKIKKNQIIYKLQMKNNNKNTFNHIDDLLTILQRKQLKIISF